jgi:two-component system, sensor histidine kinase and response regulator
MESTLHKMKPEEQVILIVDDAPENIDILTVALSGYKKIVATNGERALSIVFGLNKPDIILLDIEMPGIDGYEVCRQIKSNESTKKIPVIFLTGKTDRKDIIKGFQMGAEDYISKPFDIEELMSRVNTHLELKFGREELESVNLFLEEQVSIRTSELNNANQKLEKAMRELEVLDVTKTEFLNMLSHEIRTPLNGILTPLMMLKDSMISDELNELFTVLEESANRLEKFSYLALEITRIRANSHNVLKTTAVNVREIIQSCSNELSDSLKKNNMELLVQNLPEDIKVNGDKELIKKVFLTLIGNGISHSPANEVLKIEGRIDHGFVVYRIIDRGKGFASKVLENNFQPMILGEKHVDNKTGLELHFAKLALHSLSGEISIGNNDSYGAFVEMKLPLHLS